MTPKSRQFGCILKSARMDKRMTQEELAEELDISVSYLKDLERFKNYPSFPLFEKVIRYFNISADSVIYPEKNVESDVMREIERMLCLCDESDLRVVLATASALAEEKSDE